MTPKNSTPLYTVSPLRLTHLTQAATEQIDNMIGEIVQVSPFGIVILYIEHGELKRATPGMIGKCEQIHDS